MQEDSNFLQPARIQEDERAFTNLPELHQLLDLLVIETAVLSVVLTDEILHKDTQKRRFYLRTLY